MEIRNIATFLKVAGTQNFSKAAEQLGYSQSAVTVQIQQLEKELDTQLFERIGKRVYLTEKGQEFIFHANEIMKVTNQALNFSKKKHLPKGKLKIGGVESICTALLPDLLLKLHNTCPNIKVIIKSGTTDELIDMARSNNLDLIFTLDRKILNPEWICAAQKPEDIIFVTKKKENSKEKSVEIEKLIYEPFILTEMGAAYQYELERLLSERSLLISPILETGNTETIINLLKKGMGISFLPEFTVKKELLDGQLTRINTNLPGVRMYSQLLYHKNKWLTPQMQFFIDMVRDAMKKLS